MKDKCLVSVKGLNGVVNIYDDRVVISRKTAMGFVFQGIKGDREIYFADIKSIEFKKATMMANGYIQFITNAEMSRNQQVGVLGSKVEATKDPNAVIIRAFSKDTVNRSIEVYETASKILKQFKDNSNRNVNPSISAADEIKKFKELLDLDIITQEEFESKKKELLGI